MFQSLLEPKLYLPDEAFFLISFTFLFDLYCNYIQEIFVNLFKQQEKSGQPLDKNALFLNPVKGLDKRNTVYGVGSSQRNFYQSEIMPTTSTINEENEQLKNKLIEMNERMKAMEYQMAKFIQANSIRDPQRLDLDSKNDNNQDLFQ